MRLSRQIRRPLVAVTLLVVASLAACSDSTGPALPAVASLVASGPTDTVGLADTVRVRAVARDAAGAVVATPSLTWRSLHPLVASVDDAGLVTGLAAGNASIVVTPYGNGDVADTVLVRVRPLPYSIAIAGLADGLPALYSLAGPFSTRATAVAVVRDGSGATMAVPVRWSSSDTLVATVSATGIVTMRDPSLAWIRADAGRTAVDSAQVGGYAIPIAGPSAFTSVRLAQSGPSWLGDLSCGLATTGDAWCGSYPASSMQLVPGGHRFGAIDVGSRSACGLRVADSTLACWGDNAVAQLGLGTTTPASATTPVIAAAGRRFRAFDVGPNNTVCGIGAADSLVYCWGRNASGNTGSAPAAIDSTIEPVPGLPKAVAVTVGDGHACAIVVDTAVWCWGDPYWFASTLPIGTGRFRSASQIVAPRGYVSIAATYYGACMVDGGGKVDCLMRARQTEGTILREVVGATMARIASARADEACGVSTSGSLLCWNLNVPDTAGTTLTPVRRMRDRTVIDVSGRATVLCAINDDQILRCW